MVGLLRWGYKIPLLIEPPMTRTPLFISGYANPQMEEQLGEAVQKLIAKGAVEEVLHPHSPGFYSRLFLRPKSSGGWRPIIDLSTLNPYIQEDKQKQETQHQIRSSFLPGQWTVSIDLTDAFFHVPIHPDSRNLLRFGYKGKVYRYTALPFGLKTAPWVFTRVVSQLQVMPETKEIPIHFYLDDWIIPTDSYQTGERNSETMVDLCSNLGLLVNMDKSDLIPSQSFTYLGARYNLVTYLIAPTRENFAKIWELGQRFLHNDSLPARTWLQLIGLLHSQEKYTQFGRRRLRHIQWALRSQWKISQNRLTESVIVTAAAKRAITWWCDEDQVLKGTLVRLPDPSIDVQTDASTSGWGGHSGTRTFSGIWSKEERSLHINVLELRAVILTLRRLRPPPNVHILTHTDNTTVMMYINKQGGVGSWEMFWETEKLLQLAEDHNWILSAKHVPGHLNVLADQLSRRHQVIHTEWELHMDAVQFLFDRWGAPNIDLFATKLNKRLLVYVSPVPDPEAAYVDALSIPWDCMSAYAFPPQQILQQVLEKIHKAQSLRLILVTPLWERFPWIKVLREISSEGPVPLPLWHNLLRQPHTGIYHRDPGQLNLHAWLVVKQP